MPAQVHQSAEGVFKAEFVPRVVGEHRVHVTVCGLATAGSPYAAKVSTNIKYKFLELKEKIILKQIKI